MAPVIRALGSEAGMKSLESLIIPIEEETLHKIESDVSQFISKWRNSELLKEVANPTGKGIPDDIFAIDYVIYEGLYDQFFNNIPAFLRAGAALLGNFLVSYSGFSWKKVRINNKNTTLSLVHSECSLIVPIEEMVLFKYSGRPQFETFEELFFDILFSETAVEQTHPLIEANLIVIPGCKTFKEKYGYEIPKDILELYMLYSLPDEEFILRQLGLEAYNCCIQQNWDHFKLCISGNDYIYKQNYGKNWQKRFRGQNELLFEKKT